MVKNIKLSMKIISWTLCILILFTLLKFHQTIFPNIIQNTKIAILKTYFIVNTKSRSTTLSELNMLKIALDSKKLTFWMHVLSPDIILDDLLADSSNGQSLDCHQQAHKIGRVAYEVYGAQVFGKGNGSCHSGYYHGAMEAFLRQKGTIDLSKNIQEICKSFPTNFGQFECLHGMGHGVLAFEDYDLPSAIKLCKALGESFYQTSCYGGAFMENIMVANGQGAVPGHTTEWITNDPHFPCSLYSTELPIQYQCYYMQTSRMLMMYNNDYDKVLKECLNAPEAMIGACFRSFGRDISGQVFREPSKIIYHCSKITEKTEYVEECLLGALQVIIDFWGEDLSNQASIFCSKIPESYKKVCYNNLSTRLSTLFNTSSKRIQICDTFEPSFQEACKQKNLSS